MKKTYILILVLILASSSFSQVSQHSIEEVLNEQGKIKKGISGSYNATGYKLSYGKNGEPILKKGNPNKIQSFSWTSMGQIPGTNAQINAVAIDSNGIVYVGGIFGWPHTSFAKWDGQAWSSMGVINGTVNAIAISGSDVYVGGSFNNIDGNYSLQNIAKWDGNSWSSLGANFSPAVSNVVYAIAVSDSNVYVGGNFVVTLDPLISEETSNIVKWDGTTWSAVGGGVDQTGIRSLAADGSGNIYAGGTFINAGSIAANRIAKWNGTAWSALGSGLDNDVSAVAIDGSGNIYAGGVFTEAGGNPAKQIAVWNGTTWSELGGGVTSSYSIVNSILVTGSNIFVGGSFQSMNNLPITNIAKWNGSTWSALGQGIEGNVYAISEFNGNYFICGNYYQAGTIVAYNIAKWDGINWSPLGEGPTNQGGLTGNVYAVAVDGTDIYFGGNFSQASGLEVNNIAVWDGNTWAGLGGGVNGYVYSIVVAGQNIFVGGQFTTAGGAITTSNIAMWTKPNEIEPTGGWHALVDGVYQGVNGIVRAMLLHSDDLYVGGFFTEAATKTANYLAKWSGSAWSPVVSNWPDAVNNYVLALAANSAGDIFLGGGFSQVGGVAASHIAKWDGTNWSALGDGFDGDVWAIAVDGNNLYAGGMFGWSGSTYLGGVGKWDGSSWSSLGYGLDGVCEALSASGGYVYVGGGISTVYNSDVDWFSVNNIARWDGSSWSAIGDGTIGEIRALTHSISEGAMYVGGEFITFGDFFTGSAYAAKFTDSDNITAVGFGDETLPSNFTLNQNYPNPFNPSTQISFFLNSDSQITLDIFNILGQKVATLVNEFRNAGSYSVNFDASNLTSGIYFYKLSNGQNTLVKKMNLIK